MSFKPHFFPPLASWVARGVVMSCRGEEATIQVVDAGSPGIWREEIHVGSEAQGHARLAPEDEVLVTTEATDGRGLTLRVVPFKSELVVLSVALVRPSGVPLRLQLLANGAVSCREVFTTEEGPIGGMWSLNHGRITLMTNADFNSYELHQVEDSSLVRAVANDVVSESHVEALVVRLPTQPFMGSLEGSWAKVTEAGNIFYTSLSEDGRVTERHAFDDGDDSEWGGGWHRVAGGGCQIDIGPYRGTLMWAGNGYLAGYEEGPEGATSALEMYRTR